MAFQDAFTRADQNLEASGLWTQLDGTAGWGAVRSNQLACLTTDATGAAYYAPDTLTEAHYVQARLSTVTANSGPFLCCRLQDRNNFVGVRYDTSAKIELYRRVAGTLTAISIPATTCVVGDVIRLAVNGIIFTLYKNGTMVTTGNIGATMTGSRCGVVMRTVATNPWIDDFECGPLPFDFQNAPSSGSIFQPGGPVGGATWMYDGEKWLRRPAIIGSPTAGYRNVVINGDMMLQQRAALAAGTGSRYAPYDRWVCSSVGSTMNGALANPTLGSSPKEAYGFLNMTFTSVAGAGNYAALLQYVEGVRTLAGRRATLSFWAMADAVRPLAVELLQVFGTGGSPSATVSIPGGKVTIGAAPTMQKYTVSFDIPSIAGKTLGTNGDDYLRLNFWFDAGSNFNANASNLGQQSGTFYIGQIQLEDSPFATPFERRPWHAELQLCYRYFETVVANTCGFGAPAAGGYADYFCFPFKASKRVVPTMTYGMSSGMNLSTYNYLTPTVDVFGFQVIAAAAGNCSLYMSGTALADYI